VLVVWGLQGDELARFRRYMRYMGDVWFGVCVAAAGSSEHSRSLFRGLILCFSPSATQ
jgi:hypothetical protein